MRLPVFAVLLWVAEAAGLTVKTLVVDGRAYLELDGDDAPSCNDFLAPQINLGRCAQPRSRPPARR
jgi:hypothetical protein